MNKKRWRTAMFIKSRELPYYFMLFVIRAALLYRNLPIGYDYKFGMQFERRHLLSH